MNARATGPGSGSAATSSARNAKVELQPGERVVESPPAERSKGRKQAAQHGHPVEQRLYTSTSIHQDLAPQRMERSYAHVGIRSPEPGGAARARVPEGASSRGAQLLRCRLLNVIAQIEIRRSALGR